MSVAVRNQLRVYAELRDAPISAVFTAEEVAGRLGAPRVSPISVGWAFRNLGFDQISLRKPKRIPCHFCDTIDSKGNYSISKRSARRNKTFKPYTRKKCAKAGCGSIYGSDPATWARPTHWPGWVVQSARLQLHRVSYGQIAQATALSAKIDRFLEDAIDRASGNLTKPGALKRAIHAEIERFTTDHIRREDLAEALRESHDAPSAALLVKVSMYRKYATRKRSGNAKRVRP